MDGDAFDADLLGQARDFHGHDAVFIPAGANLDGHRDSHGGTHGAENLLETLQIAQQSRAAALDHFSRGAAEVDVHDVEAKLFDHPRGARHDLGVGAKQLAGDRMFVRLKEKITRCAGGVARDALGAREFRHDQSAAAEAANHAAKDGVGHSGHGREDRAWGDQFVANRIRRGKHFL